LELIQKNHLQYKYDVMSKSVGRRVLDGVTAPLFGIGTLAVGAVTGAAGVGTFVCLVAIPVTFGLSLIPAAPLFGLTYGGIFVTTYCGSKTGHNTYIAFGGNSHCHSARHAARACTWW
jgi:hypothetical protein